MRSLRRTRGERKRPRHRRMRSEFTVMRVGMAGARVLHWNGKDIQRSDGDQNGQTI
jgi:hypothetical protein